MNIVKDRRKQRAQRDAIFALVLDGERFFGDVGGLPNVHEFLEIYAQPLRTILADRWNELLPNCPLPLVVNTLINPNLFFCHRDAGRGQYRRYFRPIYLDRNAIEFDQGGRSDEDEAAESVVKLHRVFDDHYGMSLRSRPFLSFNDIEALRFEKTFTKPFPPAGGVVSIWRTDSRQSGQGYSIHCDSIDFWHSTNRAISESGEDQANEKFRNYLAFITDHVGSYHHVTIGNTKNWLGRVYLAFRSGQITRNDPEWVARVKDFAFDIISPLAIAGTFIRNPGIVGMLRDVRVLLDHAGNARRDHGAIFHQFFETPALVNRKVLPTIKDICGDLGAIQHLDAPRMNKIRAHLHDNLCQSCNGNNSFLHAIEACHDLGDSFLDDLIGIVKHIPDFASLNGATVEYIATALGFGLTGDDQRPNRLGRYFLRQHIPQDWIDICQRERLSLATELRPYFLALLLMVGNIAMVRANAKDLGLEIVEGVPLISQLPLGGHFVAVVQYKVSGTLNEYESGEFPFAPDQMNLHQDKNGLLAYFGNYFFDDFQMSIRTITKGTKPRVAYYRKIDEISCPEGTLSYIFSFSR